MENSIIQPAALLEARNLTKVYEDGVKALNNLQLKVHAGEIFAMLGGNGAGKTTTINTFLDFIQPTSGQALINGIDANQEPLEAKKFVASFQRMFNSTQILRLCKMSTFLFDWVEKVTTPDLIMKMLWFALDFKEMHLTKN